MPPRRGLVKVNRAAYTFHFLNEARTSALPVDWHPPELERRDAPVEVEPPLHGVPGGGRGRRLCRPGGRLGSSRTRPTVLATGSTIGTALPSPSGAWYGCSSTLCAARRWMRLPGQRLLGSLARQLRFLERNLELDLGGNHLIKNIKALLWAGRFFENGEAARWQAKGETLLRRELEEQILADGMHYERSPAYHGQVFVDPARVLPRRAGLSLEGETSGSSGRHGAGRRRFYAS